MNAPRFDSPAKPRPTHTVWPSRQQAAPPVPQRTTDTNADTRRDEEHAVDEPGYGHGV